MATDSLFGGDGSTDAIGQQSLDLLNQFLTDTVGGTAVTGMVGGGQYVVGIGSEGETQGALLPTGTPITGVLSDGVVNLDIALPAGLGLVFAGADHADPQAVGAFLQSIVDSYVPEGANDGLRLSLTHAIDDLVSGLTAVGATNIVVRMVDFVNGSVPLDSPLAASGRDVVFSASNEAGSDQVFAFNLSTLAPSDTLILQGVKSVLVAGAGSVRVEGNAGVLITSDAFDQNITGGGGADTLIGGGGHDTLTGGLGDDLFQFARLGHFEITDFSTAHDSIAFNVPGVHSVADLLPLITGVVQTDAGVTYEFGPDASITLVGATAAEITADLIKFTI